MQILSATDAVSPAFARTRLILFSPFRKGRTWKLSATAYLSFAGTIFLPFTLIYAFVALAVPTLPGVFRTFVVGLSLVLTLIYLVLFWLCGRLRFVYFDIVLNRGEFVAPAWRKYGEQSRRWNLVKILVGSIFTFVVAIPAYSAFRHFITLLPVWQKTLQPIDPKQGLSPEMANFMMAFYGSYFVAILVIGLYFLAMSTISSFVVPSMALENASVGESFRRFVAFAQREPRQLLGFVGVRFGIGLIGYFGLTIAYELVLFLLLAISALVFGAIGFMLHLIGVATPVLLVLGIIAFVLFVIVVNGYLLLLVLGPFFTFFEAHTLYFLGGRYPLVGDLLERSTPAPAIAYQQAPPYGLPCYQPPVK